MKTSLAPAFMAVIGLMPSITARILTVHNNCPMTIWPAMFTDLNAGSAKPDHPTGWSQAAGSSVSFNVPDNWTVGRIWGRTDCDFSTNPGPNSCSSGGCNGGLECDPHSGTGVPPVSLAEFTLGSASGDDFYDVSLVDGFNLPVRISNTAGCGIADCPVDLNPGCPSSLKGSTNLAGAVVGCKSDCLIDPNPSNSKSCCSGQFSTPETCPFTGVPNYNYFKKSCPNSYVFAYDEHSTTALWTCSAAKAAYFTVTFCPDSSAAPVVQPANDPTAVTSSETPASNTCTCPITGNNGLTLSMAGHGSTQGVPAGHAKRMTKIQKAKVAAL
ncbi:hypothetical protein FRB94_013685 [Tulasnella sp. JGI-2019a]|nr:hypothetical protein FRB94_013685 [Tulasnella sp. JGI-2019a]KAG9033521.1 hypothetical protein FRB95_014700 [Tulasnella sp. JGI-2019a]